MKYTHRNKSSKRFGVIWKIAAVVIAVGIALLVAVFFWYQMQLRPVSKVSKETIITVPVGSSVRQVGALLAQNGLIKNARVFEFYVRSHNLLDDLQAGQYAIDPSQSTPQIVTTITKGLIKKGSFTILPGQRLDQVRAAMLKAGFDPGAVDEALKEENYKNHPVLAYKPASLSLEGYLYPETFQTTASTTPMDIISQSLDEMADNLNPELLSAFSSQGLTPHQALTLASMVTKEASGSTDQQMIAGVFYNRIASGMLLGSDVTYQYIADITGQPRSADIDSPYNTRKYPGLPPGPISTVSQSALAAVAHPTNNDYLYFVAGDDGKIYYSKTQAEHEALVAEHCKVLCSTY